MKTIKTYECFNERRYSNPWVAVVGDDGKINFKQKIGGYTGAYGKGEAGELYITEPVESAVYAYGQKDYRGKNTEYRYIQYRNGQFVPVEKTELVAVLNGAAPEAAAEMEPAPEAEEPVNIRKLYVNQYCTYAETLLHNLGGDPDSIYAYWQDYYDNPPEPVPQLFDEISGPSDTSITAEEAVDQVRTSINSQIEHLYFAWLSRDDAVRIEHAIRHIGELRLLCGNDDLVFDDFRFRLAWDKAHPDETRLPYGTCGDDEGYHSPWKRTPFPED